MPRKLTLDEISKRVSELWDGIAQLDTTTYVNNYTLARFIDREYGEWWAKPFHVLKGTGRHPERARANTIASRKISVDDVVKRVYEKHGDRITLRIETYVDTHTKAKFIDREYGEWWAAPYSVMNGCGHPAGKLKKSIKTMRSFNPVVHWKTGEICYPASGFEHAVLVWLCANKYDFVWQCPVQMTLLTPKLQRPMIYNVDFYIKSGPFVDTYVEVKGTWVRRFGNDGGKAKWEWLHEKYPTSQLWMREDLIRLGIIDVQRSYLREARKHETS